jgi:hypothetical protein
MFRVVWGFKWRLAAYALGFAAGLLLVSAYVMLPRLSAPRAMRNESAAVARKPLCAPGDANEADDVFSSPNEVVAALKSEDVGARREVFARLFLRPGITTAFYDFERDRDYPERAEDARVRFVNLDDSPEDEAVITFVRTDSPVAVILKRDACGWRSVAAVSAWLRFEDYPYADWLELPEVILKGQHVLLVRDSTGDATHYTRRARVLRLVGGSLEQVAEIEEEAIEPVTGYAGADWPQVKRRREASYAFTPESSDSPARLHVEYKSELVRYSGVEPLNVFWHEGDGVWHQARRHWRTRAFTILKIEPKVEEQFVWNEQKNRFVQAGS